MRKIISLVCLIALACAAHAQDRPDWQHWLDQWGELEDVESEQYEAAYDLLSDLAEHPINLNDASREDLEQLPFLTKRQVEDIMEYLDRYKPMRSMGELHMITSLDETRLQLLSSFTYLGEVPQTKKWPAVSELIKHFKRELTTYFKCPLYTRHGDKNGYLGYRYKHWVRFTMHYGQYMKLGLLGAQDAGEPFFANNNKMGYDFYSFYLTLRDMGRMKQLTVGRYRLRTGLGLILNNSYNFGKMGVLSTFDNTLTHIYGHSSRMEANYMQGAAATMRLSKGIDLTAFLSYRNIDATLNKDSSTIATILRSGYHRTQSEMDRKGNAHQAAVGTNLSMQWRGFHLGLTALTTSFNRTLHPDTSRLYRRYYPRGKSFWNVSLDYGYAKGPLSVAGETATGDSKAIATINRINYSLSSDFSIMVLQRFYSYKFYSLLGRSFSEGGSVSNESGVYVGASWWPSRQWQITAYTDYAYFAWPRYQADAASKSWDNLLSVNWQQQSWSILMRYRIKVREKNNANRTELINQTTQRGRLAVVYDDGRWMSRTQGDLCKSSYKDNSFGWMVSQQLAYEWRWLRLYAIGAYFNSQSYDSRLYLHERGLMYTFSFPSFYGEGIHYGCVARASMGSHWEIVARASITDYFDRDHISSGYQQIDHSSMTDIEMQLRWRF